MTLKIVWLLVLVVATRAGWFGPHEFHEGKDELDLTLRINQKHMAALKDLETRHGIKWHLKGGLAHATASEVGKLHDMLDKLDSKQTDGKVAKQRVAQIKAAVASADYDLAAKLKEQRDKAKATPTGAIDTQSINAQIKAAVASADYDLAAKLKKQRDKAASTGVAGTQSINAQVEASLGKASDTIVTAYFKVASKHSPEQYRGWMQRMLGVRCAMVIYTEKAMEAVIRGYRSSQANQTIIRILSIAGRCQEQAREGAKDDRKLVTMHVRGTDYLNYYGMGATNITLILRAVAVLHARHKLCVLVVSDNRVWVQHNLLVPLQKSKGT
eukprot:g3210.t1